MRESRHWLDGQSNDTESLRCFLFCWLFSVFSRRLPLTSATASKQQPRRSVVRRIVNGVADTTPLGTVTTVGTKGTVISGDYQATLNGVSHTWNLVSWENSSLVTGWVVVDVLGLVSTPVPLTLTLNVHSGSASGPLLSGVLVTGSDGAGQSFNQTTGAGGYVTIAGTAGTWQFTASKAGYNENSWNQSITATETLDAYLTTTVVPVTLTLNVHSGSASGPLLAGVLVTGSGAAGREF